MHKEWKEVLGVPNGRAEGKLKPLWLQSSYTAIILCCIKHSSSIQKYFTEKLITVKQMASDVGQGLPETNRDCQRVFPPNKDYLLKSVHGHKRSKLCQEEIMHFVSSVHISIVPACLNKTAKQFSHRFR